MPTIRITRRPGRMYLTSSQSLSVLPCQDDQLMSKKWKKGNLVAIGEQTKSLLSLKTDLRGDDAETTDTVKTLNARYTTPRPEAM